MFLNQFDGESNRCRKKAVRTANLRGSGRFSAGRERELLNDFLGRLVVGGVDVAVGAAGAALLGAGAERLVNDGLDGARAPAAFGAAAEATIDLLGIPRQVPGRAHGVTDIVVADNVAGTDNHKDGGPIGDASLVLTFFDI
jgi:hypothetical protein